MELEAGAKVSDRVTLVKRLAGGAMGSVWVATHTTLQKQVAVKFMGRLSDVEHQEATERFTREATAAAKLNSPHVVQIFDHGFTDDGTAFIVMELMEGASLAEAIEDRGRLPPEEVVDIVSQVAKALAAAHAEGLVHRDIKPANIFLAEAHGEVLVKLLDFGLAKLIENAEDTRLTEPGVVMGTPRYLSPEALRGGSRHADAQVDQWALAVTAYFALTGRPPFAGKTTPMLCAAILSAEFPPPTSIAGDLPKSVDAWFARAFNIDVEARFADAGELAAAFAKAFQPEEEALRPAPAALAPVASRRAATASKLGVPAVLVAALAAGGAIVYMSTRPDGAEPPAEVALPGTTPAPTATPAPPSASSAAPEPSVADADVLPPIEDSGADPMDARRGEIFIPAGYALVAEGGEEASRQPVPAFFLFANEVTVKEFAACVVARSCSSRRVEGPTVEHPKRPRSVDCNWGRRGREQHPMNCVSLAQAESYCRWKGARLPTEQEWVRGARSDGRSPYPWGDELASCERAIMADAEGRGCGVASSHAIDDKPEDVSAFGVRNLAGNVAEWVRVGSGPLIKGGSWLDEEPNALRIDGRSSLAPTERSSRVGFRCARSGE